ncbi:ThiF family adenylyltransferase [Aliarcobacter butzleri]|uniref:ThiF family adenylyltransferase n=1 Tax=Aliarcobacter butzleri TaxID=28197 RepID=UPI00263DD76B|nr:ThiF family adenylyltransferase [Aliarcobacter butzleri]MDN5042265.1 ThiF family adenylyltransferase [Aliarcobacter butzleri]
MDKQLKLWFEQELDKADKYLKSKGFLFSDLKKFYYKKILFNDKTIDFRIKLPINYPLDYPEFYLNDESLYLKYPHIEKYINGIGSSICYLEEIKRIPYLNGYNLIYNEIQRVERILEDYKLDKFEIKDFINEFDSYWLDKKVIYLDLHAEGNEPKLHKISSCSSIFKNIITDDTEKTKLKLDILGLKYDQFQSIIYFPFNIKLKTIPLKYNQILELIEENGYKSFFEKNISLKSVSDYIYFSFFIDEIKHYACSKIDRKLFGDCYTIPKFYPNYDLERVVIKRIDRERIFLRGGNNLTSYISKTNIKIAIIGCGSLGGSLTLKLAKSGIKNFTLIDKDFLDINNIARHICSLKYLNENKVDALKHTILEHFPDCNIDTYPDNAMDCLQVLDNQNLIISALGSDGTIFETFLIQIYEHIPKIISWFEGSVGGHAMFTKTKVDNFSEIIGKLKIVADGKEKELIKDDIGCNSVYAPYAFIDAENTITAVARMVTDFIIKKDDFVNQNWTILGNLEENKGLINTKYFENDSYSVLKRDFDGNKL